MTNNSSTPGDNNKKGKGTPDDPFEPDAVYGADGRRADAVADGDAEPGGPGSQGELLGVCDLADNRAQRLCRCHR